MRDELIKLITEYKEGKELKKAEFEIFAEEKSLSRSEFYTGYTAGISVRKIFEMDPDDYDSADVKKEVDGKVVTFHPSIIEHNGENFNIVRSYKKNHSSIEVTVR